MASNNYIKFWKGTEAQYNTLKINSAIFDVNTLYFLTDSKKIMLNSVDIASNDNKTITDKIAQEVTDRNTAITSAISKEVTDRNTAIKVETDARMDADNALGRRIDDVVTAYKAADTALDIKIQANTDTIGVITDETVGKAIERLDRMDAEINSQLSDIIFSGGAMVFKGTFVSKESFDSLVRKGVAPGASFVSTVALSAADFYGHKIENGDMIIFVGKTGYTYPLTDPSDITKDMLSVVQANLSSAIQSVGDEDLGNGKVILGGTGKFVKPSSITETALSTAITKATNAVSATAIVAQTMSSTLSSPGFIGPLSGTASSATLLETSRNFSITGGATAASVGFNGGGNVTLNVTSLNAGNITGTFAQNISSIQSSTSQFGLVKMSSFNSATSTWDGIGVPLATDVGNEFKKIKESIGQVDSKVTVLSTSVGSTSDTASATGTVYARIKALSDSVLANSGAITGLTTRVGTAESNINSLSDRMFIEEGLSSTFADLLTWKVGS